MARRNKAKVEEDAAEVGNQESVLGNEEAANLEAEPQEAEPVAETKPAEAVTMEVQVRALRGAMELLGPAVPKKPTLEMMSSMLLKDGKAMASDLEVAVVVDLPGVEGKCLVPFRSVLDALKYIPGHEMLTIEQVDGELTMSWSEGKAAYDTKDAKDYPSLPKLKAKVTETVDGDMLIPALLAMVGYCATNIKDRPVLGGVSVFLGDSIAIAAGDGFRMAYKELPITIPPTDDLKTVIIPAHTIEVLNHLWRKAPRTAHDADSLVDLVASKGKIQLAFGDGRFTAKFGPVFVGSRLIAGTPPNFTQLIPQDPPMEVLVYAPDMERAVRRVRKVAEESSGIVRLVWEDKRMTVSAKADEKGAIEATIPVQSQGEPGKIALNLGYLLEYLKDKTGLLTMGVTNTEGPVTLRYGSTPLVLLMPMRANW